MKRILLIYDIENWAYHIRCVNLQRHAPADFDVDIARIGRTTWQQLGEYDLCFNLEYTSGHGFRRRINSMKLKTILVMSHNRDSRSRLEFFPDSYTPADWLIINNRECWEHHDRLPHSSNISNGIPDEFFHATPILDRGKKIIWCGSSTPKKGKGFQEILLPLAEVLKRDGWICDFRPIDHVPEPADFDRQQIVWRPDRQNEWYNSAAVVVCASESEGTPGFLLEAARTGCVPVSSFVGNLPEFAIDRRNAVICERTVEEFAEGVAYAWAHREEMSTTVRGSLQAWDYEHRAPYFYALFRRLIDDGPGNVEPFSYQDCTPEGI